MSAAACFLANASKASEGLYGVEGMNAGMLRATEAMCQCFDWGRLISEVPGADDIVQFGVLAQLLLPYLQHTEWPSKEEFPNVLHTWPSQQAFGCLILVVVILLPRPLTVCALICFIYFFKKVNLVICGASLL